MDTKTAGIIGTILKVIIGAVGTIYSVLVIANSDVIKEGKKAIYLDTALTVTQIALILCVAIAVIFGLFYFVTNIKKSKGMLAGVLGFAAVLGISYALAPSNVTFAWEAQGVTEQVSKLSSMGIIAVFVLLALAVIAALFSEVSKFIK